MVVTLNDIRVVRRKLKPLLGQKAWGIKLIGKSGNTRLLLNFGNKITGSEEGDESYGEWRLIIYSCVWRLDDRDKIVAGSMDDPEKIRLHFKSLETLPVFSFQISRPAFDTTINFDNQSYLRLFPVQVETYFHWKLWFPNFDTLTIGPGTTWAYEK